MQIEIQFNEDQNQMHAFQCRVIVHAIKDLVDIFDLPEFRKSWELSPPTFDAISLLQKTMHKCLSKEEPQLSLDSRPFLVLTK